MPLLEGATTLIAATVLDGLKRRHPERFADSVLRTPRRRSRQWRAVRAATAWAASLRHIRRGGAAGLSAAKGPSARGPYSNLIR